MMLYNNISNNYFEFRERRDILRFVREVIKRRLAGLTLPNIPDNPKLMQLGSCFVTLKINGVLRGCIGNIGAAEPLGENIRRNALNAAFHDPRFPPLECEELDQVEIEVSILTPMRQINSADEFILGKHGILMEMNGHHAVFLPQVPAEQKWDKTQTLCALAEKAGLTPFAWQNPNCKFYVFEAEVFDENNTI